MFFFCFCFCFILIITGDKLACRCKLQHSAFITVDRKTGCSSFDKSAEFGIYFTVIYCTKCDQTIALSRKVREMCFNIFNHCCSLQKDWPFLEIFRPVFFISFNVTRPSVMLLLAVVLSCQYWKEDKRQLEFMWRGAQLVAWLYLGPPVIKSENQFKVSCQSLRNNGAISWRKKKTMAAGRGPDRTQTSSCCGNLNKPTPKCWHLFSPLYITHTVSYSM